MRYEPLIRKTFQVTQTSGEEFLCMCPWHADTSQGHLYVNAVKGLYLCMSCGAKGRLDNENGIELPQITTEDIRERMKRRQASKKPPRLYPESWLAQFDVPHPYWTQQRGLSPETVQRFRLGYDPTTNRVTLPLRNMHGRILGTTYRRLDDGKPKYLHPKGFPIGRHLYGAWLLSNERKVAVTEGQVDAIKCWESRVPALGLMRSQITTDQVKVLQRCGVRHVVLMLDNDNAGVKGTLASYEMLKGAGMRVSAGWYRDYWFDVKDPDGLTGTRLRKMFHSALPMDQWAEKVLAVA